MAAVLSCGPEALLSHGSAAVLWGMWQHAPGIDVVVPFGKTRRRPGIRVHRRLRLVAENRSRVDGIPVTDPVSTLIDVAASSSETRMERAINEADRLGLTDPEALRAAIDSLPRRPGLARLRTLLDRQTFTDSKLEQRFLALVRRAALPVPETQAWVNGFRVDFLWRDLGLVVETDGLRYHRTPAQQAKDQRRDQIHTAAGWTTLRFAEAQIRYEPARVVAMLKAVVSRLQQGK
jgi:very-short-patch-repair endonuclease